VAAAARIAAGHVTVPETESDAEDAVEEEDADDDVLLVEGEVDTVAAAAGARGGGRGVAAARGRRADGSSGSNGRRSQAAAADSSDDEDLEDAADDGADGTAAAAAAAAKTPVSTPATAHRPAGARVAGGGNMARTPAVVAGPAGSSSEWWEFQLPQGSWVRSRRCDNGFRDFFGISLQQGRWDEEPWGKHMQRGGVLSLRGCIWNVR
jgi:hypothetical protein